MNTIRNKSVFPLFEEGVRGSLRRGSLLLVALLSALSLNAQMLKVYKGGAMVYCLENADSVVFCSLPHHALSGVFSVSETKQIHFSCGNLQYTQSTQTWSFAEHQYDMIGEANISNGVLADKIDLFGWSGSTATAQWGISTSTDKSDYSGDFVDWGTNTIGKDASDTWRTLTNDEWSYLLSNRTNANNLIGVARINLNADGTEYANGLILLPDNWTCPAGVTFKSGLASENSVQAYADYQTFTLSDWQQLEAAGAVFLPASGNRYGDGADAYDGLYSGYWLATPYGSYYAGTFIFSSNEAKTYGYWNRGSGHAVRLVTDL